MRRPRIAFNILSKPFDDVEAERICTRSTILNCFVLSTLREFSYSLSPWRERGSIAVSL
jgi:hypothetical protein